MGALAGGNSLAGIQSVKNGAQAALRCWHLALRQRPAAAPRRPLPQAQRGSTQLGRSGAEAIGAGA
jgi:hypothetical protein